MRLGTFLATEFNSSSTSTAPRRMSSPDQTRTNKRRRLGAAGTGSEVKRSTVGDNAHRDTGHQAERHHLCVGQIRARDFLLLG